MSLPRPRSTSAGRQVGRDAGKRRPAVAHRDVVDPRARPAVRRLHVARVAFDVQPAHGSRRPLRRPAHARNRASTTLKIAVVPPMPRASVATAAAVKAGCLRSMRNAKRTSCHTLSTTDSQPTSRTRSFTASTLPISTRAARTAASRLMPPDTFSFDGRLQVLPQFVVQVLFRAVLLEQAAEPADDPAEDGHHNSPSEALRILEMAAVWTSQSRASFLNLARPCAVIL